MKVKVVNPIIECQYCFDFEKQNGLSSERLKDCLLHNQIKRFQQEAYYLDKGIFLSFKLFLKYLCLILDRATKSRNVGQEDIW